MMETPVLNKCGSLSASMKAKCGLFTQVFNIINSLRYYEIRLIIFSKNKKELIKSLKCTVFNPVSNHMHHDTGFP